MVFVGGLVEGSADLLTGGVEVFIELLAGAFGSDFDVMRGPFGINAGVLGIAVGLLVSRGSAGAEGEGKGDYSG